MQGHRREPLLNAQTLQVSLLELCIIHCDLKIYTAKKLLLCYCAFKTAEKTKLTLQGTGKLKRQQYCQSSEQVDVISYIHGKNSS